MKLREAMAIIPFDLDESSREALERHYGECELTPPTERVEVACRDCGSRSWREVDKQPEQPKPEPEASVGFRGVDPYIIGVMRELIHESEQTQGCNTARAINHAIKAYNDKLARAIREAIEPIMEHAKFLNKDARTLLRRIADKLEEEK